MKKAVVVIITLALVSCLLLANAGAVQACTCNYEGLTPGYWKNHEESRNGLIDEERDLGHTFEIPAKLKELRQIPVIDALRFGGGRGDIGGAKILLRAAVAAYLNAAMLDKDLYYYLTTDKVLGKTNAALAGDREAMLSLAAEFDHNNNL